MGVDMGNDSKSLRDVVLAELARGTHSEAFADGARWAVQEAEKLPLVPLVVYYDKYHSGHWLAICGACHPEGMVVPFGTSEGLAREWADEHRAGHEALSVGRPSEPGWGSEWGAGT